MAHLKRKKLSSSSHYYCRAEEGGGPFHLLVPNSLEKVGVFVRMPGLRRGGKEKGEKNLPLIPIPWGRGKKWDKHIHLSALPGPQDSGGGGERGKGGKNL